MSVPRFPASKGRRASLRWSISPGWEVTRDGSAHHVMVAAHSRILVGFMPSCVPRRSKARCVINYTKCQFISLLSSPQDYLDQHDYLLITVCNMTEV